MIDPQDLLGMLDGVRGKGNSFMAKCPAHEDSSPSLAIRFTGDRILMHCFAGCETQHVCESIGLTLADLMPERAGDPKRAFEDRFRASDLLAICAHDLLVASVIVNDASSGRPVSLDAMNDLAKIAGRLQQAADLSIRGRIR